MSVDAAGLPQPGFYSYPSSLPSGLSLGDAESTARAPAASSSGSSSSASGSGTSPAAAPISPYQQAYANLEQADTAELMSVSLGSSGSAQSNIASVLQQAAALQQQQIAAQQQAAQQASSGAPAIQAPSVPNYTSIVQQSDANASSDLSNGTLGASIDTTA